MYMYKYTRYGTFGTEPRVLPKRFFCLIRHTTNNSFIKLIYKKKLKEFINMEPIRNVKRSN